MRFNYRHTLIVLLLCISVSVAFWLNTKNEPNSRLSSPELDLATEALIGEPKTELPNSETTNTSATTTAAAPIRHSNEDLAIEVGDPAFSPKNQAELDWLTRNAYPSRLAQEYADTHLIKAEDLDRPVPLTPSRILQAQFLGISNASARERAAAFLDEAAVSGATYALEALGGMYEHRRVQNPVMAEAYFRAGELLGNWGNTLRIRQYRLNNTQDELASLMAHQVVQQINARRLQRGMPPLLPDPKPGLDEFLDAIGGRNPNHP